MSFVEKYIRKKRPKYCGIPVSDSIATCSMLTKMMKTLKIIVGFGVIISIILENEVNSLPIRTFRLAKVRCVLVWELN
jgi:hypothetical protein